MKKLKSIKEIREYAIKCHDDAGCTYGDGESYSIHLDLVAKNVRRFHDVFLYDDDLTLTIAAAYCHDIIEDTNISHSKIMIFSGSKTLADIVLRVTDIPAENRLMKHLLTMHKTVGDHRSIILKLIDIYSNSSYSTKTKNIRKLSMYKKEYAYRKPIFMQALSWYKNDLDSDELDKLWIELDKILC